MSLVLGGGKMDGEREKKYIAFSCVSQKGTITERPLSSDFNLDKYKTY